VAAEFSGQIVRFDALTGAPLGLFANVSAPVGIAFQPGIVVTAPNGGEVWQEGTLQTVTWTTGGTELPPINVTDVRILLSTDGGLTFPTVLLASTPNDGSEDVRLPACVSTTTARVLVEGLGSPFVDASDADFTIADLTPPAVSVAVTRSVLWPTTRGLLDVGLTHSASDPCGGAVLQDVLVHSDEPNGVAPFAPDALLGGPTSLRLRSERAFPGDGRVYLVVPRYTDGANVAVGCATVVAPVNLTVSHLSALMLDASNQQAACLALNGAPPAGTTQILP
jgi:hypothetical protein